MADDTKLAVANRISFWLETEEGHEEYGNPSNFFNFTSENSMQEMQTVKDGLTWLLQKILKRTDTKKPAAYLFIKAVTGGRAGAIYTYPIPKIQGDRSIAALESNILTTLKEWCDANGQKMNNPVYESSLPPDDPQYNEDRYLVVTIDIKTTSL